MSTQMMPEIRLAPRPLLMPWQWSWLVFQMVLLGSVAAVSYSSSAEDEHVKCAMSEPEA